MNIGISVALDRLITLANDFSRKDSFEVQITNAEMIRECAAIIASASEEEIIDALKEKG